MAGSIPIVEMVMFGATPLAISVFGGLWLKERWDRRVYEQRWESSVHDHDCFVRDMEAIQGGGSLTDAQQHLIEVITPSPPPEPLSRKAVSALRRSQKRIERNLGN